MFAFCRAVTTDAGLTGSWVVSIYTFFKGSPTIAKVTLNLENVPGPFVAMLISRHDEDDGLTRITFNEYFHKSIEEPSSKMAREKFALRQRMGAINLF